MGDWRIIFLCIKWKSKKVLGGRFPPNNIVMSYTAVKQLAGISFKAYVY